MKIRHVFECVQSRRYDHSPTENGQRRQRNDEHHDGVEQVEIDDPVDVILGEVGLRHLPAGQVCGGSVRRGRRIVLGGEGLYRRLRRSYHVVILVRRRSSPSRTIRSALFVRPRCRDYDVLRTGKFLL